jgi:hypothetical protein
MDDVVSKLDFIEGVRRSREEWEAGISGIPQAEMLEPGFCGDWSLKDVLAHISWYEREMIHVLQSRRFEGSNLWEVSLEDRNAAIFKENEGRPLDEILIEAESSYYQLIDLLEALDEKELNDAASFPGMPLEWKPWQVLASNTYEHYDDHLAQARAWIA